MSAKTDRMEKLLTALTKVPPEEVREILNACESNPVSKMLVGGSLKDKLEAFKADIGEEAFRGLSQGPNFNARLEQWLQDRHAARGGEVLTQIINLINERNDSNFTLEEDGCNLGMLLTVGIAFAVGGVSPRGSS